MLSDCGELTWTDNEPEYMATVVKRLPRDYKQMQEQGKQISSGVNLKWTWPKKCSWPTGCDGPSMQRLIKGMCKKHYSREYRAQRKLKNETIAANRLAAGSIFLARSKNSTGSTRHGIDIKKVNTSLIRGYKVCMPNNKKE
jgi:hypothetical protein